MRNQLLFGAVVFGAAVAAIVGDPAQARAGTATSSATATAGVGTDGDVQTAFTRGSTTTDLGSHPMTLGGA